LGGTVGIASTLAHSEEHLLFFDASELDLVIATSLRRLTVAVSAETGSGPSPLHSCTGAVDSVVGLGTAATGSTAEHAVQHTAATAASSIVGGSGGRRLGNRPIEVAATGLASVVRAWLLAASNSGGLATVIAFKIAI